MRKLLFFFAFLFIFFAVLPTFAQDKKQDKTKPDEYPLRDVMTAPPSEPWGIIYFDDKTGKIVFKGNAGESAKLLFKAFQAVIDEYVAEKLKDCAGKRIKNSDTIKTGTDITTGSRIQETVGYGPQSGTIETLPCCGGGTGHTIYTAKDVLVSASDTAVWNTPATCTMSNLKEALRLATIWLKDPNERPPDWTSTMTFTDAGTATIVLDTRTPAEKLRDQAKKLEQDSRIVQWIHAVKDSCEKGKQK